VTAKEDDFLTDVPTEAFRIEYFGQGELAKVAENPLRHPELFQEFLDRHASLRDLADAEAGLISRLQENAGRLTPLEAARLQLAGKKKHLKEVEGKLKIAEEGKLRDVVGLQSKLASEKTVREAIDAIATEYSNGYILTNIQRDFNQICETAGSGTDDDKSKKTIASIRETIDASNASIKAKEAELNALLKACAKRLSILSLELKQSHQRQSNDVAVKLADLKSKGIAADIPGFEGLLRL
jgi:hypothetical protein